MVWAIVVVAIAVLGAAAWAGTGRLGEMPTSVIDRPKPYIPEGPVDQKFLDDLSLPTVGTGYRRSEVDALFSAHVGGADIEPGTRFDVVRRGYDMQAVDVVMARMRAPEKPEMTGDAHGDEGIADLPDEHSVGERKAATSEVSQRPLSDDIREQDSLNEMTVRETNMTSSVESEGASRRGLPSQ